MVFLLQNTQMRDSRAINLKLNELLRAVTEARTGMVGVEELSDARTLQSAGAVPPTPARIRDATHTGPRPARCRISAAMCAAIRDSAGSYFTTLGRPPEASTPLPAADRMPATAELTTSRALDAPDPAPHTPSTPSTNPSPLATPSATSPNRCATPSRPAPLSPASSVRSRTHPTPTC